MFREVKKYLNPNKLLVIRSSIYPGTCDKIFNIVKQHCKNLSYCPERIVQGKAIIELHKLSQIVSGKNIF